VSTSSRPPLEDRPEASEGLSRTRRRLIRAVPAVPIWLLAGCGGSGAVSTKIESTDSLPLDSVADLGLAYANSSINTSVFRQQSILALGNGLHAVGYFDEFGDACIQVLSAANSRIRSVLLDPPIERRLLADGHCSINLGYSEDDRVHFIYGAHGTLPVYGSVALATLLNLSSPVRVSGALWPRTITYPQFYRIGNELQLWFRSDPDNTIQFVRYERVAGALAERPVSVLAANGLQGPYMNQLAQLGNRLALSWVYRVPSTDGIVRNEGLYVAVSDNAGATWKTRTGMALTAPIERTALVAEYALPSSLQPLNQTSSCFAPDGTLYVSFYAKDSSGVHQIHVASFAAAGAPQIEVVSDNSQRFELTGAGTLSLPLSRPQIVASSSHVHVIYRQAGALVVASRDRALSSGAWSLTRRDAGDLGVWEPTHCRDTWDAEQRLMVYVQLVRQGPRDTDDIGNPTVARIFTFRNGTTTNR
jgi:BNR repeat-containing family member